VTEEASVPGRLEGKVAIVTGAGSGIGRDIAVALHAEGAQVVIADVSGQEKAVADELGEAALAVHADVSKWADVEAMVAAAVDGFGRLDIVVNNAGIGGTPGPTADGTEENFDRVLAVNLKGVFLVMKASIPRLVENGGGSIVNIASIAGLVGYPTLSAYAASKGGVVQLTRTAAIEYAASGLRINAVCPGPIDTPLARSSSEERLKQVVANIPVGRLGRSEEVAATTVFLASDESSFVTGQAIAVDGGWTSR
jgi:NAD(P)-dependent dehydrogenase (short-subunit alcohol dehydrogenase family)